MINFKQQYIKLSKLGLSTRGLSITKQVPLILKNTAKLIKFNDQTFIILI